MKKLKQAILIGMLCVGIGGMPVQAKMKEIEHRGEPSTMKGTQDTAYMKNFDVIFKTMQQKMSAAKETGNPSIDFLLEMTPHHEAAIAMAKEELKYGSDGDVKKIAQNIIEEQEKGIKEMQNLLTTLEQDTKENTSKQDKDYLKTYQAIYQKMVRAMGAVKAPGNVDKDFLMQMIPHHEGAIAMAENILKYTNNRELQEIAHRIVDSQNTQLKLMKQLVSSGSLK